VRKVDGPLNLEVGADVRGATGESRERATYTAGKFTKSRKAGGQTLVAGLYAEASTEVSGWLLTGGVRADEWSESNGERVEASLITGVTTLNNRPADRDGLLPTARLGARREIGGGWAWRVATYAGFRPATLNELHRPFRVGNNITESNPGLDPERLYGAETGFDFHREGLKASATLFYNQLNDAITNLTIGVGPGTFPIAGFVPAGGVLRQRQNAGAIDATGLEAEAEQALFAGVSLRGSLAYAYSKVDGGTQAPQLDGKRPALTPRFTGTFGVNWQVNPAVDLHLGGRYESARFDDDLNTLRLRPSFTADFRADWRLNSRLGVFLAVDNLTDAKVQTAETADLIYSYDAPRVVRVGVRLAT
jgi:outer membrane receptor protein involved in Fe transport